MEDLKRQFDTVILGVAHKQFLGQNVRDFLKDSKIGVIYDVKGVLDREYVDGRL